MNINQTYQPYLRFTLLDFLKENEVFTTKNLLDFLTGEVVISKRECWLLRLRLYNELSNLERIGLISKELKKPNVYTFKRIKKDDREGNVKNDNAAIFKEC